MKFEQVVEKYSKKENLFNSSSKIIVALSGGVDSVALLALFVDFRRMNKIADVAAIHINHNLRDEALHDENFCKELCNDWNVDLTVYSVDIQMVSKEQRVSIEEAGRLVRYEKFDTLIETLDFNNIATAHHRDDTVESLFINLFKGTGLKGASAIAPKLNNRYIRPLLDVSKEQIYQYAVKNELEYVVDKTNFEQKYYRNIIRNGIIPTIKEFEPEFEKKVSSFTNISREIDEYLSIHEKLELNVDIFGNNYIPRRRVEGVSASILYYRLKDHFYSWGLSEDRTQLWENLFQLLDTKSTGVVPLKDNNFLSVDSDGLRKKCDFKRDEIVIEKSFIEGKFRTLNREFKITLNNKSKNIYFLSVCSDNGLSEEIELKEENFPYKVSYRFDGVRNLKGKKLKDIFVKKRVPMSYKNYWPLLFNSDNVVYKILFIKRWL